MGPRSAHHLVPCFHSEALAGSEMESRLSAMDLHPRKRDTRTHAVPHQCTSYRLGRKWQIHQAPPVWTTKSVEPLRPAVANPHPTLLMLRTVTSSHSVERRHVSLCAVERQDRVESAPPAQVLGPSKSDWSESGHWSCWATVGASFGVSNRWILSWRGCLMRGLCQRMPLTRRSGHPQKYGSAVR